MRAKFSTLAILVAASAGCPASKGYVGAVSGTVLDPSNTPVEGASVFLSAGNINDPPTLNQPINGAPGATQITAADGTFYIGNVEAGSYPLVVTWLAPASGVLYSALQQVNIDGGAVATETVTINPCQTGPAATNPCPPPPTGPVPTPSPVGTASPPGYIPLYQPNPQTETVTHSSSTDALHLSTDSISGPEKLDLQIPHASTGWRSSPTPIDLATTAGGQIVVTYSVPSAAGATTYSTYRAVAGSLYLDGYSITPGTSAADAFSCHLENVLFEYQASSNYAYTIGQTSEMGSPVVATP